MKALLYGTEQDKELLLTWQGKNNYFSVIDRCDIYEDYIKALKEPDYDVIIVMLDSGKGYKGVGAARTVRIATPVLWFSDDKAFLQASYDNECSWFATKEEMNEERLTLAVKRSQKDMAGKLHELATTKQCIYELDSDKLEVTFVLNEESGEFLGNYPDFHSQPRYTPNRRPWVNAADNNCRFATNKQCKNCGSCDYYVQQREEDTIGICVHPRKRK